MIRVRVGPVSRVVLGCEGNKLAIERYAEVVFGFDIYYCYWYIVIIP